MTLLFNTPSRFVRTFLLRSKHLLISLLQLPFTVVLEPEERKSVTASDFPHSICHEVMGPDFMVLVFLMFSFKPASFSSFTPIKKLFSSSSLSVIRVVSSAHLRLLIFFPAILIPVESSSLGFHIMNSAYKLNKQSDNIVLSYSFLSFETVSCSMSDSKYRFLTYIQVSQESSKVVWYSHFFKYFLQFAVIHTVKAFSLVNEAEVDVSLEHPCFLHNPMNVGNLISCSSASLKPRLYIWNFSVYVLLKPRLKNFEHNFTCM